MAAALEEFKNVGAETTVPQMGPQALVRSPA